MPNKKMKELKVHHTSDLQSFSYNSQENLERSSAGTLPVGRISYRGDLAYLARGTALEVEFYICYISSMPFQLFSGLVCTLADTLSTFTRV